MMALPVPGAWHFRSGPQVGGAGSGGIASDLVLELGAVTAGGEQHGKNDGVKFHGLDLPESERPVAVNVISERLALGVKVTALVSVDCAARCPRS